MQGILPPHLAEQLAQQKPHLFAKALRHDAGLRQARETFSDTSSPGSIEVFDARGSWDDTPPNKAAATLAQAVRLHTWAAATSALLHQIDVPDGVVRYGQDYANAFYDGRSLVFGVGDGEIFGDFTLSLDIFAHEYGHKVVDAGPKLEYAGQPGALNEHIADIIGVCVRHAGQPVGSAPNWRIGDRLFLDGKSALRNMKAPGTAYSNRTLGRDPQVGHMNAYVHTFKDNGGVHINSGIPNRAFALFVENTGLPMHGEPLRIWLRTLAMSGPLTNFFYFAQACVQAAGPTWGAAVKAAWGEVGVTV
jgi:Zn-dependent metalloprotease